MLKVGLTGGIGSGKSVVARVFNVLGVPVYYADERSKYLLNNSPEVIEAIKNIFGERAYQNNLLDRKFIASVVFSDRSKLNLLNEIAHPAVHDDFAKWCSSHVDSKYVIMEAAILFESSTYKQMDFSILVTAPEELRIKRVVSRDNITEQEVKARINNQQPTGKLVPLADFIITNDDKELILPQILSIDKKIQDKWQSLANG